MADGGRWKTFLNSFALKSIEKSAEKSVQRRSDRQTEIRPTDLRKNDLRTGQSDRRKSTKKKIAPLTPYQSPDRLSDHLSVTVSIGVAEPSTRYRQPEQVIQAADQALYRAKHNGRNRVELASTATLRLAAGRRAKASRL